MHSPWLIGISHPDALLCTTTFEHRGKQYKGRYAIYASPDLRIERDKTGVPHIIPTRAHQRINYGLLLHGLGGGDTVYHHSIDEITAQTDEKARVLGVELGTHEHASRVIIAPVMAGFCGTDILDDDEANYEAVGEWLNEMLDSIQQDGVFPEGTEFDVIGHSLGTGTAMEFFRSRPNAVKSLALINGIPGHDVTDRPRNEYGRFLLDLGSHWPIAWQGAGDFVQTVSHSHGLKTFGFYVDVMKGNQQVAEMDAYRKTGKPVLLVTSTEDWIVDHRAGEAQEEHFGTRQIVAWGNHTWFMEAPNIPYFGRLISDFWTDVERKRYISAQQQIGGESELFVERELVRVGATAGAQEPSRAAQ